NTPLYDAIGSLIERAEVHQVDLVSQVVVIFTDGMENASHRWNRASVFRRVEALQEAGWVFVFMGANQDSYAEGAKSGMKAGNTSNYGADSDGVRTPWTRLSRSSRAF